MGIVQQVACGFLVLCFGEVCCIRLYPLKLDKPDKDQCEDWLIYFPEKQAVLLGRAALLLPWTIQMEFVSHTDGSLTKYSSNCGAVRSNT